MLDEIIKLFVNTDINSVCHRPIKDNGKIVATNGKVLIVAPKGYFKGYYEPNDKFPNYEAVIPEYNRGLVHFKFYSEELLNELLTIDKDRVYKDCDRCEGEGHLYTGSGKERECDECGTTGEKEFVGVLCRTPDTQITYDENHSYHLCKILNEYFNPNFLEAIARVGVEVKEDIEFVIFGKKSIIFIGDILIILMAFGKTEEDITNLFAQYNNNIKVHYLKPNK